MNEPKERKAMSTPKTPKQEYTAEFKELAVKRVKEGQATGAVARDLGLVEETLRNGVKAYDVGKLNGPGAKKVTPEGRDRALKAAGREHPAWAGERNPRRGDGVLREGCAVKYAWIDVQKDFAFGEMCAVPGVSVSGYRAWKRGGQPARKRLTEVLFNCSP